MLEVEIYQDSKEEWDDFTEKQDNSTFFHQYGWGKVIQRTYGHRSLYLSVKEDNNLRGILPLSLMKHPLFGRFLISVPFGDYGGICALDEDSEDALLLKAINLVEDKKAKYLELRNTKKMEHDNLLTKTSRVSLILPLAENPEEIWKGFKPKVRNQVRKAEKSGLEAFIGDKEMLRDFYNIFAVNMRDLGTPVHSISFFDNILDEFSDKTRVILVKSEDTTVGGGIITHFRDTIEIPWASSLREYFPMCPNNLLYWKALEYGCLNGYKYFNFGRSPWDSGTFKFKKQWGAEPVQLYYQYYLREGDEMPDYTASTSSRFDKAIWIWKHLPVGITKLIGPSIISGIPY
ncbi:FemAB family PEP-CTERM system-associated protein [Candidatus Poribacteria bacterium]|nr:FemAB family PEP-CTERM system-associated protein [Candidatus Poribacteria bacterium]